MSSNAADSIHTSDSKDSLSSKVATVGGRGVGNFEQVPSFKRHRERETFSNVRDPRWHSASSNFRSPPAPSPPLSPSPSIHYPRQRPDIPFSRRSSGTNSLQADIQQARSPRLQEIQDPRSAKSQWLSQETLPLPTRPKAYGREYSPNGRLSFQARRFSAAADYSSFRRPSARYASIGEGVLQLPGSSSTSLRPTMGDPRSTSLTLLSETFTPSTITRHDTINSRHSKKSLLHAASARYSETSSPSLSAPPSPSSLARRRAVLIPDDLSGRLSPAGRFSRKHYSNTDLQITRRELLRLEGLRSESPHSLQVPSADDYSSYHSRRPSVSSSRPSRSTNGSSSDGSQAQQSDNKNPNVGGDAQADLHARRRFDRTTSSRSNDYTPEAFRRLHGGLIPHLDLDEQRPPTHARPPITARTSTQYSKFPGPDSSQWPSEAGRTVPLSRRESYSSATGISPVSEVRPREGRYMQGYQATMDFKVNSRNASPQTHKNRSPHTHRNASPRTHRNPSPHTLNVHTQVEQIDGVNSPVGSLGVRSSPVSVPYYSNHEAQVSTPAERRKIDDFEFLNTIETTDRPYTPDRFAIDAFLSQKETVASRASSRKSSSLRSLASLGGLSLRSIGYNNNVGLNAQGTHNVLKKNKPEDKAMLEAEIKAAEATLQAAFGTSSTKSKKIRSRSRSSTVLQDLFTPDVPHTATTCAGPSRGVVVDGNRSSSETDGPGEPAGEEDFSFSRFKLRSFSGARSQRTVTVNEIGPGPHHHEGEEMTLAPAKEETTPAPAKEVVSEPATTQGTTTTAEPPQLRMDSYTSTSSIHSYSETCTPAHYISNAYRETGTVLRQTLNDGWSAAYESYKERRTLERTYRYGKAGKKVKVYMSGALPPSNEKAAIDQTLETKKSTDEKPESAAMAYGESFTNCRTNANANGNPMTASSAENKAETFRASPEKKSAFVEQFNQTEKKEMSEDKVVESSKRKLFSIRWRLKSKRV